MSMLNPQSSSDLATIAKSVGVYWCEQLPAAVDAGRDVGLILDCGLAALAQANLWGPANREISFLMWQHAGEILQPGWLQLRAREKPRGYAGDHEMLGAIYQQRVTSDPLGSAFDRYFLRQAAPQAVRNRMQLVRDRIVAFFNQDIRPKKVVVIGSGAALEIADALQLVAAEQKAGGQICLLDLDPVAISLAQQNLQPHLGNIELSAEAENLVRLPKKSTRVAAMGNADLVVCTGFFDYLEDDAAVAMVKMIWSCLNPAGEALIFNFAPWNPSRAFMEWIGNWYLLYRTRSDLARLAMTAEISALHFQVSAEATGIDLLLTLKKSD
ncbi:hypothetical protein NA78x_005526 [Anatilimnocola sp. NA78]|uniref:class I SAM-dependent methyltransferase n=1 Tax=Anatilimnocola sp. NA78 TaxID=3415683 RepID=UPI003CE481AD